VLVWLLFAALLFPVGFAGWAVGHYTSLGKSSGTKTVTVTAGPTSQAATTTAAATTTGATTTAAAAGGNAAAGKAVFAANGCGSCHTFQPAASTGTIGPNLDTAPTADAKKDNMALAAFVSQSIVDPNAYISPGFRKGLMPSTFGSSLSKTQLADLVAFIVSGQK
jgi:cytochrome c551/c552